MRRVDLSTFNNIMSARASSPGARYTISNCFEFFSACCVAAAQLRACCQCQAGQDTSHVSFEILSMFVLTARAVCAQPALCPQAGFFNSYPDAIKGDRYTDLKPSLGLLADNMLTKRILAYTHSNELSTLNQHGCNYSFPSNKD